jgi:hypothetical protein
MMKTVTEDEVAIVLPIVRKALDLAIDETLMVMPREDRETVYAAFQVAMIEKASELAKAQFATSRVDFALAARELYKDDT